MGAAGCLDILPTDPLLWTQVLELNWKGGQLWGTIEVLPTPAGLLVWELYSQVGPCLNLPETFWEFKMPPPIVASPIIAGSPRGPPPPPPAAACVASGQQLSI